MAAAFAFFFIFLMSFSRRTSGVPLSQFFAFGTDSDADDSLVKGDDESQELSGVDAGFPFVFFDQQYTRVFVTTNGLLSFGEVPGDDHLAQEFPLDSGVPVVAPFWADVDTGGTGDIWYRVTNDDSAAIQMVTSTVADAFADFPDFVANQLIIVTWDEVGYFDTNIDKTNTFQCVVATDGTDTFAIFLYLDDGINWSSGDSFTDENGDLQQGTLAQVGFDAGDGEHFLSVNGSFTEDIINVDERSNVGIPGKFVFQVNGIIRNAGEEPCPIIGTSACEDRVAKLACLYLNMSNPTASLPQPCQKLISI